MEVRLLRWTLSPATACLIAARGSGLRCPRGVAGGGIVFWGRIPPGRAPRAPPPPRGAADKWSREPGAGCAYPAVWPAVKVRAEGGAHAEQSEARTPRQRGADATPSPQRHDHAEWPAFRDCPWRRNRD